MLSTTTSRTPLRIAFIRVAATAFAALLLVLMSAVPAAHAQTSDGLSVSSTTTYTPDPTGEKIDVTSEYTLTNVQADDLVGDSVRSYYYTRWVLALPANATGFRATGGGVDLATTIDRDADSDQVVFGSMSLPFNLDYQQSVTLRVSYTVPSAEPRAEGAAARINDSFLSFSVWTAGDPGQANVRVNIPDGFTMDLQGDLDDLERVIRDGQEFYEATNIEAPRDFFGQVYGRNDNGLITETAMLPGATASVRAWPDDPEWVSFVVDAIENDVPVIEELTGLAWPAGDIEVIETVTPYLYGYGGWFNASSGLIEVGDRLERDLILHELGHAWFNDALIDGRWITEGLAEEFASRAIGASGSDQPDPDQPDLNDPLRVPLALWASPWTLSEEDAFGYELYHYNASWWVLRQITDDVGLDAFSQVLISLSADEIAYPGEGPPESTTQSTRWTHFFDLLDHQAGAENLDDLFATYVLAPVDVPKLDQRRQVLGEYDELVSLAGSWSPPIAIRTALARWEFDDASALIDGAIEVVEVRDDSAQLAKSLDVTIGHGAEVEFELAATEPDLTVVLQTETKLRDDLRSLQTARRDIEGRARDENLTMSFLPMTYDAALDDIRLHQAALDRVGDLRSQVDRRAVELGVESPPWPESGGTSFEAATGLAEARLATLDAVGVAAATVSAPRSFTEKLGLLGSDPSDQVEQAKRLFEADSLDEAIEATGQTDALIAAAASKGTTRLTWIAGATAIALLTLLLLTRHPRAESGPPLAGKEAA